MKSKKLLRLTIMDALDLLLMENGIRSSSKKIRKTIIKASEKISNSVQQDLKKQHRRNKLKAFETNKSSPFLKQLEEGAVA